MLLHIDLASFGVICTVGLPDFEFQNVEHITFWWKSQNYVARSLEMILFHSPLSS